MLNHLRSKGIIWIWVTVLVLFIDRFSKLWVIHNLDYYNPVKIIYGFNLMLSYNRGAAYSFLDTASGWQQLFLGGLAVIVSLFIVGWLTKLSNKERWLSIGLCLIMAGALGNLWDRILYHHVIDFLSFYWGSWHFAIFNIADSAISVGAFMVCAYWLFSSRSLDQANS